MQAGLALSCSVTHTLQSSRAPNGAIHAIHLALVYRNERHASWRIEKDQLKDLRVGYVPEKNSR